MKVAKMSFINEQAQFRCMWSNDKIYLGFCREPITTQPPEITSPRLLAF